jgi:hypothetical protein
MARCTSFLLLLIAAAISGPARAIPAGSWGGARAPGLLGAVGLASLLGVTRIPIVEARGFHLADKLEKAIQDAGAFLIEDAKEAFEAAMQEIFQDDILPLVDKIDTLIRQETEQIHQDIDEIVDRIGNATIAIIDEAADRAEELIGHTIEEIKTEVRTYPRAALS